MVSLPGPLPRKLAARTTRSRLISAFSPVQDWCEARETVGRSFTERMWMLFAR
jgi:hypothetical protein